MRIATVDCETDPFKFGREIKPFIWGFYDGTDYFETASTESLVDHIRKFPGTIYAHNGGKFDYFFLLPYADQGRIKVINGRIAEFRIGKARLRDSFNILPVPLAKLNKMEFDYAKLEKDVRILHMEEISKYLRSDCENLYFYVSEFIRRYSSSLTLAGAAYKEWQKMGGESSPTSEKFYQEMAPFYFGGRVSPFIPGLHSGNFRILDINSAYPRAMMEQHPTGSRFWEGRKLLDRHFKRAFLTVECDSFGAFPVRKESGGVDFPHGFGRFNITGWEFIAAVESRTITRPKIINAKVFEKTMSFEDYVLRFYEEKRNAEKRKDHATREFSKLFLNSLYGKFAANPNRYGNYIVGKWGDYAPDGYDYGPCFDSVQLFHRPLEEQEKRWFNLATAASITGYVRAFLWESICKTNRPYYCDTDSIICVDSGDLVLSDNLGDWKNEGEAEQLAIAGKKLYCAWLKNGKHKLASKGARLKPGDIKRLAQGREVVYYSDSPTFSLAEGGYRYITRRIKATA